MENMEGGANAYPEDYPFCPATPPTPDSDDSWPDFEEGVYTDDENTAPPVTCGCCREERRWLDNLQSRCGSMQAECLELATLIAAKQESKKQETRRLMKQLKKTAETMHGEFEENLTVHQQFDRLGLGMYQGYPPFIASSREEERAAEGNATTAPPPEMD
ncbi:hypothetical protein GCK32_015303 [Trichostrongylus colubriformis]|uniref:Uncharacterized protein n=1 Tax=Trichostrongylus colubriformis TaxID=6319 RepID=A0AAN8J2Z1_TRICO